jgi:FKBP-type peptidyl-prolyl cis-trans isomerase 2
MIVTRGSTVTVEYRTTDSAGVPLGGWRRARCVQGNQALGPQLDAALEGRATGDRLRVPLPDHGERDPGLVQEIRRDRLPPGPLAPGMRFHLGDEEAALVLTVVAVSADLVTVDANHPLCGVEAYLEAIVRAVT